MPFSPNPPQTTVLANPTLTGNTVAGTFQSGDTTVTGMFIRTGIISPTQITANANDYAPTGISGASSVRLNSDIARTITGLTTGTAGRRMTLHNIGTALIILAAENASSLAANRFNLPSNYNLMPGLSAEFEYDGTISRWRMVGLGVVDTVDLYSLNNNSEAITTGAVGAALLEISLTPAGVNVTPDFSTFINASLTMANNYTMKNPTVTVPGKTGRIRIQQDATGGRTLSFDTFWHRPGGTPSLTATASANDYIEYDIISSNNIVYDIKKNPT